MKTETQTLIIIILGIYAIISLLGVLILTAFQCAGETIILALVPLTSTPISILGGFIAGKTWTEKQNEEYLNSLETCEDDNV